ncbi:MAG: hypothetical protein ACE5IA_08160 [Dehalococcoidia bacterium]
MDGLTLKERAMAMPVVKAVLNLVWQRYIWPTYMGYIRNPLALHPWERQHFEPFWESIRGRHISALTKNEVQMARNLADLLAQRGFRLMRRGMRREG